MKAAIYNPYLDSLGGGERYTLMFAKALADNGWKVDVEWKDLNIAKDLENRFGINLKNINFTEDIKRGDGYDLCFWVSDGSIPTLKARKNIIHFQVPFHDVNGRNLLNKMKLFRVNNIICNSNFTKEVIDKEYGVKSNVIYPPVSVDRIKPKRKENIILYVGRFSQLKQSKRQDILIEAFKKMTDDGLLNWKLILVGGTEVGASKYLQQLNDLLKGYPIEIIASPDFSVVKDLYGKAKIFWSASGFSENEEENPEKVEHFGITVVEAMAAGVVPVVYAAGGHKEIVQENINGFFWTDVSELISKTRELVLNNKIMNKISKQSKKDSLNFSNERFEREVLSLIQ
jgi:glycosyltransferase involved in cell wall biosynthesis